MRRNAILPLRRRIQLLISRAIGKLVDSSGAIQVMQLSLLADETLDGVPHMEGYGRTANPPAGFEALTASMGGNRGSTVCLTACHRSYRLVGLSAGEVALYDDQGQVVRLARDKTIHVYGADHLNAEAAIDTTIACPQVTISAGTKITLDSPEVDITGNLTIGGNAAAAGDVSDGVRSLSGDRAIYNSHTHVGDSGGTTDVPQQQE